MPDSSFTQISKAMKRFIAQVIAFLVIIASIDRLCGVAFKYLEDNAKGGFSLRDRYINQELNADVIIYGSSRCAHHYDPAIFQDSLGLSCYNAGQDGSGIILSYGRLLLQNKRKKPQIIICDINPDFDLFVCDNHRFLHWLKSYYYEEGISDIFNSIDKTEKFKMLSWMYRYNSRFIEIMVDYFHPMQKLNENGFVPNRGEMDKTKIRSREGIDSFVFDEVKIHYIDKFIDECRDSKLIFVVSPIWYGMDENALYPLREICQQKNVVLLEFENNIKYVHNDFYFYDGNHLNSRGADEFSKDLCVILKQRVINENSFSF